ncbi:MAG: copper-translocating P-type ATPase, partial [Caulobacteraceae bacterium]|nr:copper-translocating P-type ATPase [Caulobacteraceae bacterium]
MSKAHDHDHHHHRPHDPRTPPGPDVRDPVCGMTVDPETTPHHAEHAGHDFHFCSTGCRQKFVADPDKYAGPARPTPAKGPQGVIYTCPMHPQVRQIGPGVCPICGMALEPAAGHAGEPDDTELNDMSRRFWTGLAITAPLFVLEMSGHLLGRPLLMGPAAAWLQLALASPVVIWAGAPFFHRGWLSLVNRSLNMFTLIALGVGVAYAYSVVATLAPQLFPPGLRDEHGAVPLYYEAAAVITVLALLGQVLELRARRRTSGAIRALMDLAPKTARRIGANGADEEIGLDQVQVGDRLRVRPGEKVPVDGEVLEGRVAIDEALVTGESMPVTKDVGDQVIGGSLNRTGAFVMRADKVGADTVLARIVDMVAQAQRSRAPIQRMADRVSAWFVPLVMAVAVAAFAGWMLVGPEPRLAYALV